MTEWLHFHFSLSCIGEGNGNPLHCSCLENPRDRGAWWAAVHGVAQSQTWLKWLSSSSRSFSYLESQLWNMHQWTIPQSWINKVLAVVGNLFSHYVIGVSVMYTMATLSEQSVRTFTIWQGHRGKRKEYVKSSFHPWLCSTTVHRVTVSDTT